MYSSKQVEDYSSPDWIGFIQPAQAMLLNAFSSVNQISGYSNKLLDNLKLSKEVALKLVNPFIENETPIYTEFKGVKVLFPKSVLIKKNRSKTSIRPANPSCDFNCPTIDLTPDRMHKAPQSLLFMHTNRCVTNCKYCYADRQMKYSALTTNQVFSIIEQAQVLGMTYIDVIGGEIFCRSDWNVILKKLVDCHLMPSYISTKVPLAENTVRLLFETGYTNVIQVSLDSTDDHVLGEIIGTGKGYVERMKRTIEWLVQYGFKIQIDTILTSLNSNRKCINGLFAYIRTIPNLVYWEVRVPEVSIYTPLQFKQVQGTKEQIVDIGDYINSVIIPMAEFKVYKQERVYDEVFNDGNSHTFSQGTYRSRSSSLKTNLGVSYDFSPESSVGIRYEFSRMPKSHYTAQSDADVVSESLVGSVTSHSGINSQSHQHSVNAYSDIRLGAKKYSD